MFENFKNIFLRKFFPNEVRLMEELNAKAFKAAELNRLTSQWFGSTTTLSQDIKAGKERLLARSRNAVQNEPLAKKYVNLLAKNIVGPDGFILRVKSYDYKNEGGRTIKQLDVYANTLIQDEWQKWGKKACTVKGIPFRQLSKQLIKTIGRDGEVFVLLIYTNTNKWGITTQVVESEFCPSSFNDLRLRNGNYIFMGIEYDWATSKPVRYYFKKDRNYHVTNTSVIEDFVSYPASDVIHLFDAEFSDMNRGVPPLAAALVRLHHLNGYEEAILTKARAVAATTLVLTKKENANSGALNNIAGAVKDTSNNTVRNISPLEVFINPDGYESKDFDPKAPTGQEGPFTNLLIRIIASSLDVSYIALGNDYAGVNYTSSRTALLDERDTYIDMQAWFTEMFLNVIFEKWLEIAITIKAINLPITKFEKFNNPWFYGRRWKWVDPEAEVNANVTANKNNIRTLEDILSEAGSDFEEHIEQLAYEKKRLEELGLMVSGDVTINKVVKNEKK